MVKWLAISPEHGPFCVQLRAVSDVAETCTVPAPVEWETARRVSDRHRFWRNVLERHGTGERNCVRANRYAAPDNRAVPDLNVLAKRYRRLTPYAKIGDRRQI